MDEDIDKVSGIDSGVESEINEETIDKNKCLDDSGGFFSEISMNNDNQRNIISDNNEIYNAELNRCRNMPKLPIKDDPLQWWEEHKHKFPILYRLSMRFLSIPATYAPSERVWSIVSRIITRDRAQLDLNSVSALIF